MLRAGIAFCGIMMTTTLFAADKHPFNVDDYSALRGARARAVSPDGKTILYEVVYDGIAGPANKHEWHLMDMSGESARKLDLPDDFEPAGFTADGLSLYGTYLVAEMGQLAVVPLGSGKATQILALPSGIKSVTISPDGSRFAILADPRKKSPLAKVRTVVENDETSIYVSSVDGAHGAWWCSELKGIAEIAWSPDSSQVAVVSATQKIGHHEPQSFIDVCSSTGARRVAEISNSTSGIAWNNGGRELVFSSTITHTLTPEHIWTVPAAGGAAVDRTPNLAGTAITVSGDSRGNIWVEMHKGVIAETDKFEDGKLETAYRWPGGVIEGPPVFPMNANAPNALVFNVGDPTHSVKVAVPRGKDLQKLTKEGDDTLANVDLGDVRIVHWTSKEGIKLEGIATFPAGYSEGKKYAFVVLPHGGPEGNDLFDLDILSRLVAGAGYVVLQPEYRGSTGYGADFLSAIYQHFGDRAFRDVDSATDFAVAQGWADPNRLAIFGWSAGGFMTSWTITQTNRYRAAIEGAGITDWLSFIPTSDIWQVDYDARLQEKNPEAMLQFSAVMYADRVTTPLLILHGEADQRVPTFQGREFFILLAERGKTVRMVTYPGSPHFPKLAEQRRDVFAEVNDWLHRYDP